MEDFLQKLREQAIYFKVESNPKFGGGVGIDDVLNLLSKLKQSYLEFVDIEYDRVNTETDKKKLKSIKEGLHEENTLVIVDLNFSSFASAVSPNFVTNTFELPSIGHPLDWKLGAFNNYKSLVFESDYNDEAFLKGVSSTYTPEQRNKIFKPLFESVSNRKDTKITFGIGSGKQLRPLPKPLPKSINILTPSLEKISEPMEKRTSMAMVEIRGQVKRPKVLELFEEQKVPIISYDTIMGTKKKYELNFPIYCELHRIDELYTLENKQFGLYATGSNLEEAKSGLFEEFEYILERYNSLPDNKLTDDVKNIKQALKLIIA